MAEYKIETINFDEERLDLIGSLITKVESILSPKPKSVWHLPGAEQRILSSMVQILNHGCMEDSEGKSRLWSFIFGLRVIRPDLWPNYELKYGGGNIPIEELVSLWLQISLRSHLLSNQLKALVDDRRRICTYYHNWAFMRSEIYTNSLLIVLQALECNSQDILARINPSLMVKFYSKKKKDQEKERLSFTATENVVENNKNTSGSDVARTENLRHFLPVISAPDDANLRDVHLSVWGEDQLAINSSKISPSFFQVDYSSSMFSDSEKGDNNKHASVSTKKTSKEESVISDTATKSCLNLLPHRKDEDSVNELQSNPNHFTPISSSLNNLYEVPCSLKEFVQNNDIVKPSPFLLQYLASKSKFSLTESCDFVKKLSNVNSKDPSMLHTKSLDIEDNLTNSSEFPRYESSENQSSKEICPPSITSKPSTFNAKLSTVKSKRNKVSTNEKLKSCTGAVVQSSSSSVTLKRSHVRSYSDGVKSIIPETSLSSTSVSFPDKSTSSSHLSVKKRFMEDGGQSITPEADGFFPHPEPGQTLMDFLTSDQFSKTSAQLDRENAHFSIAEAVLAALEQINYESKGKEKSVISPRQYESEDDNLNSKQLHYNRRKLRDRSSIPAFAKSSDDEPATTDHSIFDSPEPESTDISDAESCCTLNENQSKEVEEELDNQTTSTVDPSSAENVAIAILMHYNSKLLPKASELQWLVSEQDVPQKLLPLPDSVPISPDDAEGEKFHPLLRGTSDWAPPRPQLILTLHKNTKRKARLQVQKWRCAGCGLIVSEKLSSHFRLCHYLGRYFCTSCHTNKKAVIPAKVLHNWDFKKYAVCNFSSELLNRMSADPLFHLGTLNPRLYKQSRDLHQAHIYRLQLFHARTYVMTCNRATKEREVLDSYPHHWSTEPQVYSLDDLLSVKKGQIINQIKHLTTTLLTHISKCQICMGQGFICEICREGSPIFPFQLDAVTQCTKCRECFHFLCFSPNRPCPRCQRRGKREDDNGGSDR